MGLPIYNKEGEKSPLNSLLLLLFLLKDSACSIGTSCTVDFLCSSVIRGFHSQGRMDNPRGPAKGSFLQSTPSRLSGLRARLIKLHRKTRGQHSPSSVCQQLSSLIFALELTDTGEAGLGEATSGSVLRALCGKGAPRAPGSGVPRGISQSIPGELRVRRGTRCWAAFAKYPKARQAPWAGTGDALPSSARLSGSLPRPSASSPSLSPPLTSCLGHPARLEHRALVPARLLGKVPRSQAAALVASARRRAAWGGQRLLCRRGGPGRGSALPLAEHPGRCSAVRPPCLPPVSLLSYLLAFALPEDEFPLHLRAPAWHVRRNRWLLSSGLGPLASGVATGL